jgi:hypothetical protein
MPVGIDGMRCKIKHARFKAPGVPVYAFNNDTKPMLPPEGSL